MVFLNLIRWRNLLIILATQCLVLLFLREHQYIGDLSVPMWRISFSIIGSTLLLSAGGYIINDYLDVKADATNRPDKLVVGKYMPPRYALLAYFAVSLLGVGVSLVAPWEFTLFATLIGIGLFYYSLVWKRKLIIGNLFVAMSVASTIAVLLWIPVQFLHNWIIFYFLFAFILTWIREIIKDIEDIKGDEAVGCQTIPIKWGIPCAKLVVRWLIDSCLLLLLISLIYLGYWQAWWPMAWLLLAVVLPILHLRIKKLPPAHQHSDFSSISTTLKWIMLFGIGSMILTHV